MRQLSLHTRISLVLTALAASLLLVLAGLWLHGARSGIHEEIEAASRVSAQWLKGLAVGMQEAPPVELQRRLLTLVEPLGRIRANELRVLGPDGSVLYRSPPPTYKAGRTVPAWFAHLLTPEFHERAVAVGNFHLILQPDASRSVIDAWDDLMTMAGRALILLGLLFVASHWALGRALRPLDQVMGALDQTGLGRFDTRLPVFATPELGRLSRAFNSMADRLQAAVNDNVRLETEREVDEQMQARLTDERRSIARELHDELAQGITAVRALAGAIAQRTEDQPALQGHARNIVAVTGEMQDGVRGILYRLRPVSSAGLRSALERTLIAWQLKHGEIVLVQKLEVDAIRVADEVAQAVLRIIQEGLTNVIRHAGATRVELSMAHRDGCLQFSLADNGRGCDGQASPEAGSGLGLTGVAERIAELGGQLIIDNRQGEGFCLTVCLPCAITPVNQEEEA